MAKKTLAEIHQQIDKLQQEAAALKAKEKGGVVARILEAIAHYDLTPQELFGKAVVAKPTRKSAKPASKGKATKSTAAIKYRDDAGNAWVGKGKRPAWFNAALAAGKTPEDLLVK
ncbi:H-NS family nucleoid-associated regulatory protein [Ideonella sp. A 288]|uniref:H-NS histone family protein n=1 Tax=Ideonella sp. A 288 TaxID=1962181 RepID=UPI000B4B7771|nr:H-NS histone family protein [Ideonella sp. A 288]